MTLDRDIIIIPYAHRRAVERW